MASLAQLIASATLNLIFGWLVMLSIGFAGLAEWLVHFVLSPNFINIPYTTNEFVTLGWTLTRDFANIFFIIVLVIIGLATALRLGEYQWQKTLPLLIGIALLINFTPVILGLIIDASNIIMDFFVSGIAEKGFFAPLMDAWVSSAFEITQRASWLEIAITPGFFIAFNFTAGVIYLLFAALFVLRYIALWTLVILSPIAFLCYILPRTRQVFEMWWNQFLQWCIIGIAATFFLYLANQLLFLIIANPGFVNKGDREGWGLINSLVPYSVVLGFLIIGFFVALTTSAMGATGIITAAQKGVKRAGKWAAKKGWEETKGWGREARGRIAGSERVQRIAQRMATYTPSTRFGRVAGAPFLAISRAMGRAVGPSLIEAERKDIDAAEKKVTGTRLETKMAAWASAGTNRDRIGILNAMIKDKDIDDAMNRQRVGNAAITRAEIERLYPIAQARDKHQTLRSSFPDIAARNLPGITRIPAGVSPLEYVLERVKPASYENVSRATLNNDAFINAVIERGMGEHVSRLVAAHQRAAAEALETRLRALATDTGVTPMQYLLNRNPRLHRYFTRGAGRGLIGI